MYIHEETNSFDWTCGNGWALISFMHQSSHGCKSKRISGVQSKIWTAIFGLMLYARSVSAAEQRTDDCNAPDSKHYVTLVQQEGAFGQSYELQLRSVDKDQPLFERPAGGYAYFKAALDPTNFKCLWSPDSRFVAISERGTKRSGGTTLYSLQADKVQEIAMPDLLPLIKPHLTAEIRASWVRPEVWLPNHELILSACGTQNEEERSKFEFRFILNLRLQTDKNGHSVAKVVSLRQDQSVNPQDDEASANP